MVPQFINEYKIIKKIGAGGFSIVYLAEKEDVQYAIKVPRIADETISPTQVKAFLKEIELWAKLDHKNIVRVYDYGTTPFPYIVTELCEGNLRERLDNISVDEVFNVILEIGDALDYAHHFGIVHRDIKPENILFKNNTPKLTDWGIAKVLLNPTTTTGFIGTPSYSAPEQFDSETFGSVDWRTDIWQFGCLMYELFEKTLPFEGKSLVELIQKVVSKPPRKFEKTPNWMQRIILGCLEKEKRKRWKTMSYILREIEENLNLEKHKRTRKYTPVSKTNQERDRSINGIKRSTVTKQITAETKVRSSVNRAEKEITELIEKKSYLDALKKLVYSPLPVGRVRTLFHKILQDVIDNREHSKLVDLLIEIMNNYPLYSTYTNSEDKEEFIKEICSKIVEKNAVGIKKFGDYLNYSYAFKYHTSPEINSLVYRVVAEKLIEYGFIEEAQRMSDKIKDDLDRGSVYLALSDALIKRGDVDKAQKFLKKADKLIYRNFRI